MSKILIIMVMLSSILIVGCTNISDVNSNMEDLEANKVEKNSLVGEEENKSNHPAVYRYFKAVVDEDLEAFMNSFSNDAIITVVSRDLDTKEKMENFAEREVFGGEYEIYRAELTDSEIRILLQFTPQGWTSPEPMAVYDFTIENDLITNANLQYATEDDKAYFQDLSLNGTDILPYGFNEYLRGVDENSGEILASAFTSEGSVRDVSRMFEGQDAITKWANNEVQSLEYQVLKIIFTKEGTILYNHINFGSGSSGFYGSYDLTLNQENNLIEYADLQYTNEEEMFY